MFQEKLLALSYHKKEISEKTNSVVLRKTVVHNILNRLTCLMCNVNVSPQMTYMYVSLCVR